MSTNELPAWAKVTPQEFMAWLTTNRDNTVGASRDGTNCPYYNFLRSVYQTGDTTSVCGEASSVLDGTYITVPHPVWLHMFIYRLDNLTTEHDAGRLVGGEECLEIMKKIMEELNGSENTQQN